MANVNVNTTQITPLVINSKNYRKVAWTSNGPVANDILSILDYCLVTRCGWTIAYSQTAKRVYKPATGLGVVQFKTDGTDVLGNSLSVGTYSIIGAEDIDSSGILINFFGGDNSGLKFKMAEDWTFVGNSKFFYLYFYQEDYCIAGDYQLNQNLYTGSPASSSGPNKNLASFSSFGHFNSIRNSVYDVIIQGSTDTSVMSDFGVNNFNKGNNYQVHNTFIMRPNDLNTISGTCATFFDTNTNARASGADRFINKELYFKKQQLICGDSVSDYPINQKIIGTVPGFFGICNSTEKYNSNYVYHNYSQGDRFFVSYNNSNQATIELMAVVYNEKVMFINVTDWSI